MQKLNLRETSSYAKLHTVSPRLGESWGTLENTNVKYEFSNSKYENISAFSSKNKTFMKPQVFLSYKLFPLG